MKNLLTGSYFTSNIPTYSFFDSFYWFFVSKAKHYNYSTDSFISILDIYIGINCGLNGESDRTNLYYPFYKV